MAFTYDGDTGDFAELGDYVETTRLGYFNNGIRGKIGGWGDNDGMIALIALDRPLADGRTIVGWPIVCLKKVNETVQESWTRAWDTVINDSDDQLFDHLYGQSEPETNRGIRVDADGYTIWEGGNYRPVDKDVVVAVKVRGNIPHDPVPAGKWPQICWMHRHKDDDMNKWDIVAYKVLK